jgi:hypothetical protein
MNDIMIKLMRQADAVLAEHLGNEEISLEEFEALNNALWSGVYTEDELRSFLIPNDNNSCFWKWADD